MKLRNKRTGEIDDVSIVHSANKIKGVVEHEDGVQCLFAYTLKEFNEEWEDCEDETQYTISDDGEVVPYAVDYIDEGTDKGRKSIGNYFKTKEEAEKAVEKLKAWERMKDTGCKPIAWKWKQDYPNDACYVEVVLKCQFDSGVHDKELDLLFGGEE